MNTTRNILKTKTHSAVEQAFKYFMSLICFLWFVYPVCFGLCEGGNVLQHDSERIFYGILDVLILCVVFHYYSLSSRPTWASTESKVKSTPTWNSNHHQLPQNQTLKPHLLIQS